MGLRVVAVDAGSVRPVKKSKFGKFGWAAWAMPGGPPDQVVGHSGTEMAVGRDPGGVVRCVLEGLKQHDLVALGVECPLMLPVPSAWEELGKARTGESHYAWSAGPGTAAMATGLVQLAWILGKVAAAVPTSATTIPSRWSAEVPLLLWEAFVSGGAKAARDNDRHIADARAAVRAFLRQLGRLRELGDVHVGGHGAFNLAAAAALQAGLRIKPSELSEPLRVVLAGLSDTHDFDVPR